MNKWFNNLGAELGSSVTSANRAFGKLFQPQQTKSRYGNCLVDPNRFDEVQSNRTPPTMCLLKSKPTNKREVPLLYIKGREGSKLPCAFKGNPNPLLTTNLKRRVKETNSDKVTLSQMRYACNQSTSKNTRRKVGLKKTKNIKKTKKRKIHVGKRGGLYVIKYKKNLLTGQNTAYKSYLKK